MAQLSDFPKSDHRPPGPSPDLGYIARIGEDEARYILKPDIQFSRPWIATPGGTAFVWPLGVEGFQITSNAEAGIHHYIGDNGVDVDLVYPDEEHVVMTGMFPGKTSVINMRKLKKVILEPSSEAGKILALPGIESQLLYIQIINRQFNHDQGDFTHVITYSIEGIRVGYGTTLKVAPLKPAGQNPTAQSQPRGKSHSRTVVRAHGQTLRSIAKKVYGDTSAASMRALVAKNTTEFEKAGVTSFKVTTTKIPTGTKLNI